MTAARKNYASRVVVRLADAEAGVMPRKGFYRDVLNERTCGARNLSMSVNIITAGVTTDDIVHDAEMAWYILSGRGWIIMEGERHEIGPGVAVFAPATGGVHSFDILPDQDLTYVLVFSPPQPLKTTE